MHLRHPSRCLASLSPNQALLTAAVLAALAVPAAAQLQFAELPRKVFPVANNNTGSLAFGDVDGDGDLDLVIGNAQRQNRLYLNNGTGTFSDATASRMPVATDNTVSVALGDVDGDGDLDMVLGNLYQQTRLYLNNGAGTFTDATASRMPVGNYDTTSLAFGDVDGDGDLDLVMGNAVRFHSGQSRLYLNNGTGTFTDGTVGRMPMDNDSTTSVALGDVDGDRDLDLVIGNWPYPLSGQNRLYLNNGTGTFTDATATRMPVLNDKTYSVALGDVDGDTDLDIMIGNGFGQQNRLYLNNGTGTFTDATATRMPVGNYQTHSLALGDVDGDGDLDLVVGNGGVSGGQSRLYLNNGAGTFTDATASRMPVGNYDTTSLAFGDVDGDGDLDLVIGNFGQQPNRLYLNLQRQLHAPVDLRIGQPYTLDAYMRYGPVGQGTFALAVVSFLPASTAIPPYGTLGLAQPLIALPLITLPQPAGSGSLTLAIPNLPVYVGISVYSQALLVAFPNARLSNVVFDVLQ